MLAADSTAPADYKKGIANACTEGDMTKSLLATNSVVTHYMDLQSQNENALCQDCPPNIVCKTTGDVVYPYGSLASNTAFAEWCVGKSPHINWYDANNGNLLVQMDDRRVSQYGNAYCIDANSEQFTAGSAAFMSDYYPDHARTSDTDNTFLQNMIVKCPFLSNTRTQQRYLDTIQWTRLDETKWSAHTLQAATYTYTTYAFFDDTEDNIYGYSYCDRDEEFYTSERITSHSEFQDSTETVNTECTLYEYFSPNFPMCVPNYGGFISPTTHDRPTETAVPDNYLTTLFQNDDYTGIKLSQCPEFTSALMVEGGTNPYYTCHISNLGVCKDSTSDYCNNGQDYMCPDGWNKKASTSGWTFTNTINDCESCGAGQVCSASTTSTTCPDGYNCEAMTSDVNSKPGQPGEFLTRDSAGENNDISSCSNGYCEGITYSANLQTCPAGYFNNYSGASASGQHSQAGCYPTPGGTFSSSQTACTSGKMCPVGSALADVNIPAGYWSASTSAASINDLTACPAGKFCAAGSTSANTDCDAGYYCEEATTFQYDTPCSFGKTAPAGSSSVSDCAACASGAFC